MEAPTVIKHELASPKIKEEALPIRIADVPNETRVHVIFEDGKEVLEILSSDSELDSDLECINEYSGMTSDTMVDFFLDQGSDSEGKYLFQLNLIVLY
jgi:hypothetical protein